MNSQYSHPENTAPEAFMGNGPPQYARSDSDYASPSYLQMLSEAPSWGDTRSPTAFNTTQDSVPCGSQPVSLDFHQAAPTPPPYAHSTMPAPQRYLTNPNPAYTRFHSTPSTINQSPRLLPAQDYIQRAPAPVVVASQDPSLEQAQYMPTPTIAVPPRLHISVAHSKRGRHSRHSRASTTPQANTEESPARGPYQRREEVFQSIQMAQREMHEINLKLNDGDLTRRLSRACTNLTHALASSAYIVDGQGEEQSESTRSATLTVLEHVAAAQSHLLGLMRKRLEKPIELTSALTKIPSIWSHLQSGQTALFDGAEWEIADPLRAISRLEEQYGMTASPRTGFGGEMDTEPTTKRTKTIPTRSDIVVVESDTSSGEQTGAAGH